MASGAAAGRLIIAVEYIHDLRWRFYFPVRPESTVREFKLEINISFRIPVNEQILIHMGQNLEDDRTMGSYGLHNGHVIYLAHNFVRASSASASVAAAPVHVNSPTVPSQGSGGGNSASLISGLHGSSSGTGVLIHVQCSSEMRFDIRVRPELTVGGFKGLITQHQNIPVNEQRLIYSGHFLQDDRTLGSYGVQEGHVIHLARRSVHVTSSASAVAAPVGGNRTPYISTGVASLQSLGFGGGASSSFGDGLVDFGQVHQQILGNPNIMSELMNIPPTWDILNNPEIIRNTVISNLHHTELLYVLNNPALRQRIEARRNNELLRAIMRDRIMSNIALSEVYEYMQDN